MYIHVKYMCIYLSIIVSVCVCIVLFSLKKEGDPAIYIEQDEPGRHANENKADTERKKNMCDLPFMWNLKKPNT